MGLRHTSHDTAVKFMSQDRILPIGSSHRDSIALFCVWFMSHWYNTTVWFMLQDSIDIILLYNTDFRGRAASHVESYEKFGEHWGCQLQSECVAQDQPTDQK